MNAASRDFQMGALSFRIDAASGMLRQLRFGGHEVLRGVYPAVRDAAWRTLTPTVAPMTIKEESGALHIVLQARIGGAGVELTWQATIEVVGEKKLTYRWHAHARSTFETNRTGLCVLHPAEAAGAPCQIEHADGRTTAAYFPSTISPHQPFTHVRCITHRFAPGAEVSVRMDGEIFETEDQRNWTDASFKTYCRPLDWPRPYSVTVGQHIEHTVTIAVAGTPPALRSPRAALPLARAATGGVDLPQIGFGLHAPLTPALGARVRALQPAHIRVETTEARIDATVAWARETADALGCALELAVCGATTAAIPPESLPPQSTVLLFDEHGNTAGPACISAWRARGHERVGTGTINHFTELNRLRPSAAGAHTLINVGINAQVHAFDDASLLETVTQHGVVAWHAHALGTPRAVSVSPVVLGPRADSPDSRLHSAFGALWALASLTELTSAEVARATYFQLHGPAGFLASTEATPLEQLFLALAGATDAEPLSLPDIAASAGSPLHALLVSGPSGRRLLVGYSGELPVELIVPFSGAARALGALHSEPFNAGALHLSPGSLWQLDLSS